MTFREAIRLHGRRAENFPGFYTHKASFAEGAKFMKEKAEEWFRNNWRNYVNVDADGVVCFAHWKDDFDKAMTEE